MNIALLTDGLYPFTTGGMQKHSLLLTKHLARLGVHVDLYFVLPPETHVKVEQLFSPDEQDCISLKRIEEPKDFYFPGHYIWNSFLKSKAIYKTLTENTAPDFIYAQGFTGWKTLREKKQGNSLPPIGVNFHGLEMYQKAASFKSTAEKWMYRPFVNWNLLHADFALSLGGNLSGIIHQVTGAETDIITSPNGIDSSWIQKTDEIPKDPNQKKRFVFIGRYERRKGVQELNRVLVDLSKQGHEFEFDVMGPVPENLRLDLPHVNYWGLVKEEEHIKDTLQKADFLVCPSYSEGLPTVILEAMASGCAIIATQVGAVDALVSNENGWLIQPGNEKELSNAMLQAIQIQSEALQKKKEKSLELVQDYTWDRVAEETLKNIRNVL